MGDAALSNLGGVGALPGLDLQFVMELLAGLFLPDCFWQVCASVPF